MLRAINRVALTTIALLLAGVLWDTARAAPRLPMWPTGSFQRHFSSGIRRELAPFLPRMLLGAPIQAVVVLQLSDCTGNLRILDLLHRPSLRDRLQLAVLWYDGPATDSTAIRKLLPLWTRATPLQPLPPAAFRELSALGHSSTPMLVVLDQIGRVRFTSQSPRSSREFVGLRNIIEGLTWIEEL